MAQSPLNAPSHTGPLELEDIQGILLDPYDSLPAACYLLLQITDAAAARRWLQGLPLTSSMGHRTAPAAPALNAAFTWPGLKALRERDDPLLFPAREFREGMVTNHRSRVLGDLELSAPESWRWRGDEASASSDVVHLALLAYAADGEALETLVNGTLSVAGAEGVRLIERIDAVELLGSKEHFGFRDGIGQPLVEGDSEGKAGDQVIAAGEFILGYRNGFGGFGLSPAIAEIEAGAGEFGPSHFDAGARDIGRNGSYMVFRQLAQDVQAFWRFAQKAVEADSPGAPDAPVALAAKMVGRWPSGASLVLHPERDPGVLPDSDTFSYAESDAEGYRVPLGSHARRANPRDALVPSVKVSKRVVGHHRILRRARSYGPPVTSSMDPAAITAAAPDGVERGLNFICFNADIGRQFQFVQHAWLNSAKFTTLYEDASPLLGDREPNNKGVLFTVQGAPVRRRYPGIEQFVHVRGGAYFFLPGIRAFRFLAGETP